MKKIIIAIMLLLSGFFFGLSKMDDIKIALHKKEKELMAKKMQDDFDKMIRLVNGSRQKMVKY